MATYPAMLVFPHPTLTPIAGKPTYAALTKMRAELYANARAIDSNAGGGAHGHLAVIMSDADYLALGNTVAFDPPVSPGDAPQIAPNASQATISRDTYQYNRDLAEYRRYLQVQQSLRQQLLGAVQHSFLRELEDATMGFAEVTARQMLEHLFKNFGEIDHEEIEAARARLSIPWNPDEPIEDLFHRIAQVRRLCQDAGDPMSEATALTLTMSMFERANLFRPYCREWHDLTKANKTMERFKRHFRNAAKDHKRMATTAAMGYGGSNLAEEIAAAVRAELSRTAASPAAHAANNADPAGAPTAHTVDVGGHPMYYCWTHGLSSNSSHTSMTCQHRAEGHQETATITNMMGGCNLISQGRRARRNGRAGTNRSGNGRNGNTGSANNATEQE